MGPLAGLKIIEFAGIGPGPLAGMILADLGATVTVIRRPGKGGLGDQLAGAAPRDVLARGKVALGIDLKRPEGVALALQLVAHSDALIEGNRPGVMERLGLGPDVCLEKNPRLIYGRMTGWGQSGPLAHAAGHDLNYIALTGLLGLGRTGDAPPRVPATLTGDAIGALGLAFGIVAAAWECSRSGRGQVVDAAISDIAAHLGSLAYWIAAAGQLGGKEPSPFYDSPFYDLYACSDGQWITLGALEPQFYALLLDKLGLTDVPPGAQYDVRQWPALKTRLQALFISAPQAHWCALLEGSDACFAPVLSPAQAAHHPHNVARQTFRPGAGVEANPAPRFSRSIPAPAEAVEGKATATDGSGVAADGEAKAPDGASLPAALAALNLPAAQLKALYSDGIIC